MTEKVIVTYQDKKVGTIALTPDNRLCTFEYDANWLNDGFSISPLELPLQKGTFIAKPMPFSGNFGIFEDSLPDGYGRYLLHKALARDGVDFRSLSALDKLTLIGNGGMGALCYHPQRMIMKEESIEDFDLLQSKALEVLREVQEKDVNLLLFKSGNSGGARPKALFSDKEGHWMVKFRHTYDPKDIGISEFKYNQLARKCGISVPDFKLTNNKYFTVKRFDIDENGERLHTATVGAILGLSLSEPVLDYSNLLALTGFITQSDEDVEEMFRRMIFNYLMDNKDDHCKNFSFLVKKESGNYRWRLAPAYDLTLCREGYNGQHATSVNGKDRPTTDDFIKVGMANQMSKERCLAIINEMSSILK